MQHSKAYFQEMIDGLLDIKGYLEERLKLVNEIHAGAIRLGKQELVTDLEEEAARVIRLVKITENQIKLHEVELALAWR